MRIVNSEITKPRDELVESIKSLSTDNRQAIKSLQDDISQNKIDYLEFTKALTSIFEDSLTRLEAIDHSVDFNGLVVPIAKEINSLRNSIGMVTEGVARIKMNPTLNLPAPDLTEINTALENIPKHFNELFQEFDVMETDELRKNFKQIIELLTKISLKNWASSGGGTYVPLVNGSVSVVNPDGSNVGGGVSNALTDTELRASPVPVTGTVTSTEISPTTLVAFRTTVSTAGARVQLATNTVVAGVLQAPSTNTGVIYLGGSNVSSSVFGAELQPGQSVGVAIDNTNKLWVDASVSTDKVSFLGSA